MARVAVCTRCKWRSEHVASEEEGRELYDAHDCRGKIEAIMASATLVRLAMEEARRRGRMYLAYPAYDRATAPQVIEEMVTILERDLPEKS